ncbi:MAG TPA: SAM-dependent chlorinase/fluorinase [Anaeromyxobacteraceae bacterium]|nr:SAM-dependent chlorinase/fluorinase [Anaeromyxobacteraceae bacterium]
MPSIVTLLSDFGADSGYPAQMKGVLLRAVPGASLVDLSHAIPAFDVTAGALMLEGCVGAFPVSAVHLAVVDPGVGGARRPICVVDREGRRFVGPDNGLFTPFLDGATVRLLSAPGIVPVPASATFHGRDLFAPVAGWLAGGGDAARLGPEVADPVWLEWSVAQRKGDEVVGRTLAADPFGNLITSIREADVAGDVTSVWVGERRARWVRTFGDAREGELLALVGSGGRVEIAVREGSAALALGAAKGLPVRLRVG